MSYGFKCRKYQLKESHATVLALIASVWLITTCLLTLRSKGHFCFLPLVTMQTLYLNLGICAVLAIAALFSLWKVLKTPTVIRLGSFVWNEKDFCRGWLITGTTGSGKTSAGLNKILDELCRNSPEWGGFVIDDKGLFWGTVQKILKKHGLEDKLVLLQLRDNQTDTINFLGDTSIPSSTYAKILCDVAKTGGQESAGDGFFATQAQTHIENFLELIRTFPEGIALGNIFELLTSKASFDAGTSKLFRDKNTLKVASLQRAFEELWIQPPGQLGGVLSNIHNYLFPFRKQPILDLVNAKEPTHSIADIERGKILCISLPASLEAERRYIHTLLKMCFYLQALSRFSRSSKERKQSNLLVFVADEAQQIVNASSSAGLNDHEVVAKIREAKATVVAATQSFLSLIPPLKDETRAKVFMANLANRISFKAADAESAHVISETFGKRKIWRGKINGINHYDEELWLPPEQLRNLKTFQAIVNHCEAGFAKKTLHPVKV